MKKTLKSYLPINENRKAYIEKCRLELAKWIETNEGELAIGEDNISAILSSREPINPEFGLVQQIGTLQYW